MHAQTESTDNREEDCRATFSCVYLEKKLNFMVCVQASDREKPGGALTSIVQAVEIPEDGIFLSENSETELIWDTLERPHVSPGTQCWQVSRNIIDSSSRYAAFKSGTWSSAFIFKQKNFWVVKRWFEKAGVVISQAAWRAGSLPAFIKYKIIFFIYKKIFKFLLNLVFYLKGPDFFIKSNNKLNIEKCSARQHLNTILSFFCINAFTRMGSKQTPFNWPLLRLNMRQLRVQNRREVQTWFRGPINVYTGLVFFCFLWPNQTKTNERPVIKLSSPAHGGDLARHVYTDAATAGAGGGGQDKNNFCFLVTQSCSPSPFQNRAASFLYPPLDSGKFLLKPLLTPCVPDFTMAHMVPQHTAFNGQCCGDNCKLQLFAEAATEKSQHGTCLYGYSECRRSFTGLLILVFGGKKT